jgi:hypothetical protein
MVARHKLVKNINLDGALDSALVSIYSPRTAHLDDDALSDGGEDYISDEHQGRIITLLHGLATSAYSALLNDGLDQVREFIGSAEHSGLSNEAIKDVLWECNFDIEETLKWALGASDLCSIIRSQLAVQRHKKRTALHRNVKVSFITFVCSSSLPCTRFCGPTL